MNDASPKGGTFERDRLGVRYGGDVPLAMSAVPMIAGRRSAAVLVGRIEPGVPRPIAMLAAAFTPRTAPVVSRRVVIEPPADGQTDSHALGLVSALALQPGAYEIRVATELPDGTAGSVHTFVDVPDFMDDPLTIRPISRIIGQPSTAVQPGARQLSDRQPRSAFGPDGAISWRTQRMRLPSLLCVSMLALACDSAFHSPAQPSPLLSPLPAPSPAPAAALPSGIRTIEAGQKVEVPYLGWDERHARFALTVPTSGDLVVRVNWRVSPWDIGWYSLTYNARTLTGDSEIVVRVPVLVGQTFEFTVNNTWPWDPDPGFVLTTWIE